MNALKKMVLLVSMALAIAALGVPASAHAEEWTMEGGALTENQTWEIQGPLFYGNGLGGLFCKDVYQDWDLEPGATAKIKKWVDKGGCVGSGVLNGCTATATAEKLPWEVEIKNGAIVITGQVISFKLAPSPPCPATIKITGAAAAAPDNPAAISSLAFSGTEESEFGSFLESGEGEVEPPETIGIE